MDGRRRLRVLGGAQIAEEPVAAAAAEALAERLEDLEVADLAAAALAEDAADERGGGDDVALVPVGGPLRAAEGRVLAGHLRRVEARLGDVGVDAGDVVADVALDLPAGLAVEVVEQVDLALEVGLGVGRDRPLLLVEVAVALRAAGEARELRPPDVAEGVHEEEAVLGGGVADAEHRPVAGGAVDVRDAEGVADDRHVRARAVAALLPALDAEAGVLEEALEVRALQPRRGEDQVPVAVELVGVVLRLGARGEEVEELREARRPVGARRQDVPEAAVVVVPVRLGGRLGGGRHGGRQPGDQRGESRHEDGGDLPCPAICVLPHR